MVFVQPLQTDHHVLRANTAPSVVALTQLVALVVYIACIVVGKHGMHKRNKLVHSGDDCRCPHRVGLGQLHEAEHDGHASPEVARTALFGTDPAVSTLMTENVAGCSVDLGNETWMMTKRGIGQRHDTVKPVRKAFVQVTVFMRTA